MSGNPDLAELPSLSFYRKLEIIDVTGTKINAVHAWVELLDSLYYFKYTVEKNW